MFKDLDVVLKKARAIKHMLISAQSECGNPKPLEKKVSCVDFKHKKHKKMVQG